MPYLKNIWYCALYLIIALNSLSLNSLAQAPASVKTLIGKISGYNDQLPIEKLYLQV